MTAPIDKPTSDAAGPVKPVAVIDIGSSSIRMALAEIRANGAVRNLETLTQAVNLGRDTFTRGSISKATTEECVQVLRKYRRFLQQYQIERPDQIRVVATSAVREASNRMAFLDRIYVGTGFQIEPLDEAEVNRITYLSIQPFLAAEPELATARTIVTEVGGGSTELLVVRGEDVVFSQTYRLGSMRLWETLEALRAPVNKFRSIIETQIERTIEDIADSVPKGDGVEMVAMGGDVRFAVRKLHPDWDGQKLARVKVSELEDFTDKILQLSEDKLVRKYRISFPEAETLGAALLANVLLAKKFQLSHVRVSNVSLRDGLFTEMATGAAWSREFSKQIIRSADDLGRKYEYDRPHAAHVADLSSKLFHALQDEHRLPARQEVLLYVAALLHEIGLFVSNRSYHKHTLYLIRNSELFGLSKKDLLLTSLVARYHRRASPQPTHEGYALLDRDERVAVAKMAALLRIAVALDESRTQRIHEVECIREADRVIIQVPKVEDLALEQLALKQNGSMFEEIFGLSVLLRPDRE